MVDQHDQQRSLHEHLHRQRQLGPLRGLPATVLPAGRVGPAAAGGRRRPLVLRRVRRLRVQRLRATAAQRHEAGRRRPRVPAVRDRRRRHHPALGQRRRQHHLEARRRRHLQELVAAVLPERQPHSQLRQRRQVRQPHRLLPAGARHRARRQPQHRLHHRVHLDSLGLPARHPLVPGRRHQRRRAADGRHHGGREHLLASPRRPAHGIREPSALQRPEHVLGHHPGLQQHQRLRPLQGPGRLRPRHRAGLAQGRRAGGGPGDVHARGGQPGRDQPDRHQPPPPPGRSSTAGRSPSPVPSPTRATHRSRTGGSTSSCARATGSTGTATRPTRAASGASRSPSSCGATSAGRRSSPVRTPSRA